MKPYCYPGPKRLAAAAKLAGFPDDVLEVAVPVLTHRVITTFAAQAEGLDAKQIIGRLISESLEQK